MLERNSKIYILIFDDEKAKLKIKKIVYVDVGHGRRHPVYRFYDANNDCVCEVRYGNAMANALQRGLWTHTKNSLKYFDSITGWIDYSDNAILVRLFSHALIATSSGHEAALKELEKDIKKQKKDLTQK